MKSIIFTAQEARNLEKFKVITIEKPMKPCPPKDTAAFQDTPDGDMSVPVTMRGEPCSMPITKPFLRGQAVYVREPWHRLDNPKGGFSEFTRYNYASSATAEPQVYKWASPVSMPVDAAQHFGIIKSIESLYKKDFGGVWVITIEKISKSHAEAIDAGLPFSDAADEGSVSDTVTYKGDMTPDDFATMQDSLGTDEVMTEIKGDMLTVESADDKLPALPIEPNYETRLDDIRHRRQELESFTAGKTLSEEAAKAVREEFAALAAEEIAVTKAAGISNGFDFSVMEPPTAIEHDAALTPPEVAEAGDTPEAETPPVDEQKPGNAPSEAPPSGYNFGADWSITTGACKYCGQITEVGGGHYSQADADAAAGQICKCPNASRERRILKNIQNGRDRIQQLFGDNAPALGFKPIDVIEPVNLLKDAVELVARHQISGLAVSIRGYCKAKIGLTSKDKIKVERSEAHTCQLEAGE